MDARAHQSRLLRQITTYYPPDGDPRRLRPALRKAFMACPRHRFLKRFKTAWNGPTHSLTKGTLEELLPLIYSDNALQIYVDKAGKPLPASNSEPGFAMYLLEMLDLRRGQRAMEIGSGGGWLSAIIAQVVGPKGRVVGIEVNPDLAEHSRQCIRSLGREIDLDNLIIMTGDGDKSIAPSPPYDRVIVTAGSQSFPIALFDQIADNGKVIIPLSNSGGGEEVFLLSKDGNCFRSIAATTAFFVPLIGSSQLKDFDGVVLDDLPIWRRLREQQCFSRPFWLGGRGERDVMMRSFRFRSYLSKTEPNYRVFIKKKKDRRRWSGSTFGVIDERAESIAVIEGHNLVGYGLPKAAKTLLRSYRNWTKVFCQPGYVLTSPCIGQATPDGHRAANGWSVEDLVSSSGR